MIHKIEKPIGEVILEIIDYRDDDSEFRQFSGADLWTDPDTGRIGTFTASHDRPETLAQNLYSISYHYHTENCSITSPKNSRYLNASSVIAEIFKDYTNSEFTIISWKDEKRDHPHLKTGFEKLERILQG